MADNPEIVAEVHADISPFQKGMKDAVDTAGVSSKAILDELKKVEGGFAAVKEAVSSVEGAVKLLGRLAVGGGIAVGLFKGIGETLSQLTRIQEGADAIGVTTDAFQELTFAMGRAGVVQADQNALLLEFATQAAHASAGFGDLFDSLDKYNGSALDAVKESGNLQGQLAAVANAVRDAAGEEERAAIVTAAFGKNSDELRRFLIGGASAIEDAAQKAREFGVVIDEDLVRKAPEIQDKFQSAAAVIGVTFQNALLAAAPAVIAFTGQLADLVQNVVIPAISEFNHLATSINLLFASSNLGENSLSVLQAKLRDVNSEIARTTQAINNIGPDDPARGTRAEMFAMNKLAQLQMQQAEIEKEIGARGFRASIETTPSFRTDTKPGPNASASSRASNELIKIEQDYLKATQQTTAVIELEHQKRLDSLRKMLDEGLISYGDFVKAEAELEATATAKINAEAVKRIKPLTDAISNDLGRAFDEFVRTGKLNSEELFRSMLADIAKVAFQMSVLQPLFGGGATPGGGIIGNVLAGVFHDGGMVGSGGPSRMVSGLAFARAPRYHDGGVAGLKSGEVPAILQRGEGVLSRGQMAAGAGGGNNTLVQVYNQSGGEVKEERSRQGNTDVVRILVGAVRDDMGRGGFDSIFRGRFGTSAVTGRR